VRVLPDVPAVGKEFDYLVPESLSVEVRVGSMVRVPLHGRRVGAWVVEDGVEPPPGVQLRGIAKVTGLGPPPELIELARWAAWRWAGSPVTFLRLASPRRRVLSLPAPGRSGPVPQGPSPLGPPRVDAGAPPTGAPAYGPPERPRSRWPPAGGPAAGPLPHGPPARPRLGRPLPGLEELAAEAFSRGRAVVRVPPASDPFPFVQHACSLGDGLVLVPSVRAAVRMARRLRETGLAVALAPADWADAAAGGAVVVGARAAAWMPTPKLAAVVVIDAHDSAYQEERAPTWSAWRVAAERADRMGSPCVLTTACPTVDLLDWGEQLAPPRSLERSGWPALQVVDRRKEDPRAGLYSPSLVGLLRSERRVLCLMNRKGRGRLLACTACGELARCARCGSSTEQVSDGLRCRACGQERARFCESCGAATLKVLRFGVSRAREDLQAILGCPVGEITAEIDAVPDERVVVGTEAALHRLPDTEAVAFLDFDQELLAPRFSAAEDALALLARAARLVGGRHRDGRLLVQTRLPEHEVIDAAVHADPSRLAVVERARRAALRLPPETALALVSGPGAAEFLEGLPRSVEVLGPGDGRWLVRAPDHRLLADALAGAPRPSERVRVEVDPRRA
jgi:primosomal protein N' (replication factor Y)